jgi:hypothetical protein
MPLWKLIKYKVMIGLAGFTRGARSRRAARIAGVGAIGVAVVLFAVGAYELFALLRSAGAAGAGAAGAMVTLTFHGILILALLFDIATTTNVFFLSGDLNLLVAAPLPAAKVFTLKYLEAMAAGSLVAVFLALPVVGGYGAAFSAPAVFYPVLVAAMFVFLSIPVSIGTICGLVISRYIRPSRVREVLGVLSGVLSLGIWIGFQFFKPTAATIGRIEDVSSRLNALASGGTGSLLSLLPSRFPAQIITSLASGADRSAWLPAAYLLAVAGAAFAVSLVLAQRIYLSGWSSAAPASRRTRHPSARPRRSGAASMLLRWLPAPERAILGTTAHLLVRDPQQITPIATLTAMMALFPFLAGRGGITGFKSTMILYSIAMLSFAGSMNLATSAVVIHGRAFWHLLVAPSTPMRKLGSQLAVSALFFWPLATVLAAAFGLAGVMAWAFVPKVSLLAACFTAIGSSTGVWIGISFADWDWDTPRRMVKMPGRLLGIGVLMAMFFILAFALRALTGGSGPAEELSWTLLLPLAGLAAIFAYLVLLGTSAKMKRMEWKS